MLYILLAENENSVKTLEKVADVKKTNLLNFPRLFCKTTQQPAEAYNTGFNIIKLGFLNGVSIQYINWSYNNYINTDNVLFEAE